MKKNLVTTFLKKSKFRLNKFIPLLIFLTCLPLSACNLVRNTETKSSSQNPSNPPEVLADTTTSTPEPDKQTSPTPKAFSFTTLKEAYDKAIPLKCSYTNPDGQSATVIFKANQFLISQTSKQGFLTTAIIRNNLMWIYNDASTDGVVISFDHLPKDVGLFIKNKHILSPLDIISALETEKQTCLPIEISETDFSPPKDINFR